MSVKTKVKKYNDRATRLSPRSWIKKKNSDPHVISNRVQWPYPKSKMNTIEEKKKGLEKIASRLSLVSILRTIIYYLGIFYTSITERVISLFIIFQSW